MNAENAVMISGLVTLGSTVSESVLPAKYGGRGELPSSRLLFGTAIAFTGLSILAELAPQVAVPLSASVAITALIYYGVPIMDRYFNNGESKLPIGFSKESSK